MKFAQRLGIQRVGQLRLGGEVVVEAAVGHAGFLPNLVHRGAHEAVFEEHLGGSFEDAGLGGKWVHVLEYRSRVILQSSA